MKYISNKYNFNQSNNIMTRVKILIEGFLCERCGHKWVPRLKENPRVCPKCHSPYWDKPRNKKNGDR